MNPCAPPQPAANAFALTREEQAHYAAERQRTRGFFKTGPGLTTLFVAGLTAIGADGLVARGNMLGGLALAVGGFIVVVAAVWHFSQRPQRPPISALVEGVVEHDEDDNGSHDFVVGEQRVTLPPHWYQHLEPGSRRSIRIATPPGEAVGVVLAIDGLASATFERDNKLGPWPTFDPRVMIGLVLTALATAFSLFNLMTFAPDDVSLADGLAAVPAATVPELVYETTPTALSEALAAPGTVSIGAATLIPTQYIRDSPVAAGWVLIDDATRARLIEVRKNMAATARSKPGTVTLPVTPPLDLAVGDIAAYIHQRPGTQLGESGRPGDQVLLWLSRSREFSGMRLREPSDSPLWLWPQERANALVLAGLSTFIGAVSLPTLLILVLLFARRRSQRRHFRTKVAQLYANTPSRLLGFGSPVAET